MRAVWFASAIATIMLGQRPAQPDHLGIGIGRCFGARCSPKMIRVLLRVRCKTEVDFENKIRQLEALLGSLLRTNTLFVQPRRHG
jgi:hypothetical protein